MRHRRLQAGGNFGPLFDKDPIAKVRDASTGIVAAIPDYSGALGGVIKLLWDDPTPGAVLDQESLR